MRLLQAGDLQLRFMHAGRELFDTLVALLLLLASGLQTGLQRLHLLLRSCDIPLRLAQACLQRIQLLLAFQHALHLILAAIKNSTISLVNIAIFGQQADACWQC